MKSSDIRTALRLRFPKESHALMFEVAPSTGGGTRYADAVAFGLWASHGHAIEGIEIKVSRSDFLNEMKQPEKSEPVMRFCNRWWLATPRDLVKPDELPTTWGLLELQDNGTMRVRVKAPKLEPVAPTLGFMAAMMRRHAGLDEEMAEQALRMRLSEAVKRETEELRRQFVDRAQERVKAAEESLALLNQIKEETGIDLTSFRWGRGDQLGKALLALTNMNCKYDGLRQIRERLDRMTKALDEIGELVSSVEPDATTL